MLDPSALDNHGVFPEDLTNRQREALTICQQYFASTGEPCSVRYLSRRMKIHHTTVRDHLAALCRKGWLPTATTHPRRADRG